MDWWSDLKYFKRSEFFCKCGCGEADMDEQFMRKLDSARETLGFPLPISSGYRCPRHNNNVSSTGFTGPHTTGKACDIALSHARASRALGVLHFLFEGMGVNQKGEGRFLHVDDCGPDRLWSY